jgi:CO/xanthine dehydrogenase FAD-binding subunit
VGGGSFGSAAVLDISRVAELKDLRIAADEISLGGGVTWSELLATDLPSGFAGLKAAALEVGSVQIQNRGTLAGNLCNASPAADGVPPLLTLDAVLELQSAKGKRRLPLAEFITGSRRIALRPGELVTAIVVPRALAEGRSSFLKLGSRRFLVISIVSVAALLVVDERGGIETARVAVGACSPVGLRLTELEVALEGQPMAPRLADLVTENHVRPLTPIDDVRATAGYRKDAGIEIVRRALLACVDDRAGGMA